MKKHRFLTALATFGAALALALAVVSTLQHIRISKEGLVDPSFCAISDKINCDVVNASSYSEMFNIPIAWWGTAYYLTLLILAVSILASKEEGARRASAVFGWLFASAGMLYCAYLAYIAFFVLGVACLECLGMYLGTFLIWVGLFPSMEVSVKQIPAFLIKYVLAVFGRGSMDFPLNLGRHIGLAALLLGTAAISFSSIAGDMPSSGNIDMLVKKHFEQPVRNMQVDAGWPVWGNAKSKVTIVEFSDFQCPFCKVSALSFRPYIQEFKNSVRFYFVNFPLDSECNPNVSWRMHPNACLAAQATVCANRFGDFWKYHDEVFKDNRNITKESLIKLAKNEGWDAGDFESCLTDPGTLDQIRKDTSAGGRANITGTPSIFINNRLLQGWRDPKLVRAIIKEELKRTGK